MRIQIRRWDDFQHYDRSKRSPPWIRLYRKLLDDREYRRLPAEAKALLVDLWLLASESKDGTVTGTPADLAWRLRLSEQDITMAIENIAAVQDTDGHPKWIELDDSGVPARRPPEAIPYQSSTETEHIRPEAEAEAAPPHAVTDSLQRRRNQARARLTPEGQEAFDGFMRAAGNPDALALEINQLCDGGRHKLYTPTHVSQALHDLRVSGVNRPTARQLRRWTEAASTPDAPIKGTERMDTVLERVLAKQEGTHAPVA